MKINLLVISLDCQTYAAWASTPQAPAALSRHSHSSNKPLASMEYAQAAIKYVVTAYVNRKI